MMTKHYHKDDGDETIWHDGNLVDCPETEWIEWSDVLTVDGKPVKLAVGMSMSVTLPPNTFCRRRYIDSVEAIC